MIWRIRFHRFCSAGTRALRPEVLNKCMVSDFPPVLDTLSYRLPEVNPDQNPGEPVLGCRLGETAVRSGHR
jgi:hypothetical protein